jgi:DNA mismatch repair protein MutS
MQVDKTTLNDLAIFHREEEQSIFHHLNFTNTVGGKEYLRYLFANPHTDIHKIQQTQQTIKLILEKEDQWPSMITNGTIMVVLKFYESQIDSIPHEPNLVNALYYKTVNAHDYSLIKFSVTQFINFARGLQQVITTFDDDEKNPRLLQTIIEKIKLITNRPKINTMMNWNQSDKPGIIDNLTFGNYLLYQFKQQAIELVEIFHRLDAYYSMAMAAKKYRLCFPAVEKSSFPFIESTNLKHLLVPQAVSYDVGLNQKSNFQFLTGANMAGKSTYIKAVGIAVYLAHIGMAVPADSLRLSLFDGLLSNIQVEDNISKGESFFFNEVQRVKKTIEKINDGRNWLILIDELFKGTNVQDAMKCSTTVIEGLRKMKNTLFILSTHLYEIGEGLKQYQNIRFDYFETRIENGELVFSYNLKEGISNDRLGYLILQREGVVTMLENL